jgi:hypothetical protein
MTEPVILSALALSRDPVILAQTAAAAGGKAIPGAVPPAIAIDAPAPGSTFRIDATPAMPAIACRAKITGVAPDPTPTTKFTWQLTIREKAPAGTCPSAGVLCIYSEDALDVIGGAWTPSLTTIQGGDVTITVRANVAGIAVTATTTATVLGTNPTTAAVVAACGGAGTDADRIACHENGRQQFDQNGMPALGRGNPGGPPGGDVGIMQLCNPAATCQQRWNWKASVAAGVALLTSKRTSARAYLRSRTPSGPFLNDQRMTDADVLQRETLQQYNRGHFWQWDATTKRWTSKPPDGYVAKVLSCR